MAWGMVSIGVFVATMLATKLLISQASKLGLQDAPNARSSHKMSVPTGGGLVFISLSVIGWILLDVAQPASLISPIAALIVLAGVSFLDDISSLSVKLRLVIHGICCAAVTLPIAAAYGQDHGLLWQVSIGAVWFTLFWHTNLFNFMDGIDALAGCQAMFLCAAMAIFGSFFSWQFVPHAIVLGSALLGFLVFNRHPAKIFMGDVGSISLGFVLAWFLLDLGMRTSLAPIFILPLYFIWDATVTLISRVLRAENPFQAHRDHAYQVAVDSGSSQGMVVLKISIVNLMLFGIAVAAMRYPLISIMSAIALVEFARRHLSKV